MTSREYEKVLVISTGHIQRNDDTLLSDEDESTPLITYPYDAGYIVSVCSLGEYSNSKAELLKYGFSKEFVHVLNVAQYEKCTHVKFDRDGPCYDDLPYFDW